MLDPEPFSQLVVVGASAGGVEALSVLVAALPPDFPVPIVVAQHLDPRRPSHLEAVLSVRSTLPVRTVTDHEPLVAGVVFVVPSNRHVEITDHAVRVRPDGDGETGPHPSVDLLLTSAAAVYGEGLVAVILTGTGTDGTEGAREVKAAGGTVVSENPETAKFPGMPRSLAPSTVDIVAELDAIGPLLHDLFNGAFVVPALGEGGHLQRLLDRVQESSGIDFGNYKPETIRRRLQRRLAATGTTTLDDYVRYLRAHPEEYQRLASSFLIKVTRFFRDPEPFVYLRDQVLPRLIDEARARKELRLWSAGCATGEEAYSIAILVADLLGNELPDWTVRIFATDLDPNAVAFARRGIYPAEAVTELPSELVDRHFTRLDSDYEVKRGIRALVVFGEHDLGHRAPFPRVDLVLCRNVLIYFVGELQKRALQLFAFALREGGSLMLGKSETVTPLSEFFVLEESRLKVYRRAGKRMLIPPGRSPEPARGASARGPASPARGHVPDRVGGSPIVARARPVAHRPDHQLLGLPIGVVTVDRHYDVQAINPAARQLLGIVNPADGEDLIHLVPGSLALPLRNVIETAFHSETVTLALHLLADAGTFEARDLSLSAHRNPTSDVGNGDTVTVVVSDVTELVRPRRDLEAECARLRADVTRFEERIREEGELIAQLRRANDQLAGAHSMQRSENEQLLVWSEEAQAATEEVETLNEELQATNEELETLNEELQATVEELNTLNGDMQGRGVELRELALRADAERVRLEAILGGIGDAVLVVDEDGCDVLTNIAYDRMFAAVGFAPADEHGRPLPDAATPQRRVAAGETFTMQFSILGTDETRRWYEASGQPMPAASGLAGGVVAIRDVTERSLRQLQDQWLAVAGHELRTPLTALIGSLQLANRIGDAATEHEPGRRYIRLALDQAKRMTGLINELMDAARLQSGQMELKRADLDLQPLVARVVETARVLTQELTIQLEADAGPLLARGDAARLEQVLLNLLTNALAYAAESGRIEVRLCRWEDEAQIDVQDFGPGIAADELPRIFTRYHRGPRSDQRRQGGLGLGLFIAHQIVTAHGGRIEVASVVGEGTTFTVRLPLLGVAKAAPTSPEVDLTT